MNGLQRALSIALTASLAFALSACQQGIPRDGSVQVGLSNLDVNDQSVIFTPKGPEDGDSPEDIVRGFTNAASSSTKDYAIARKFLTPEFARQWDAHASVLVDDKARTFTPLGDNGFDLTVSPIARVDEDGIMTLSPPSSNTDLNYEFEEVDGEWRISRAPSGLLLDRATFSLVFSQQTLYFIEPRQQTLVPDTRWFSVGSTLATDVVTALLDGPSPQLSGATSSAFTLEMTLTADAVPVVNGIASIDLTPEAATVDRDTLDLMKKQIRASLQRVPEVTEAQLSVDQTVFAQTPVVRGEAVDYPQVATNPVIQLGTELGELAGVTLISLGTWVRPVLAEKPSELTIRNGNDAAVLLSANGLSWADDQGVTLLDNRTGLASPTLDRSDVVWSSQQTAPTQVSLYKRTSPLATLQAPWFAADEVRALRISTDGTRLAALVLNNGQANVQVAGVQRDGEGTPIGLTPAKTVAWLSGTPVDLDWMNATQLAIVSQPNTGATRISTAGLGIFEAATGSTADIASLAGANDRAEMHAISTQGVILAPQGVTWKSVVKNITLLAKRS